jgi:hypothetical protein
MPFAANATRYWTLLLIMGALGAWMYYCIEGRKHTGEEMEGVECGEFFPKKTSNTPSVSINGAIYISYT